MAASLSPTRGVSFSADMEETQIYNPEDLVTSVVRFKTSDAKGVSEKFNPRSILKISTSPIALDHEMLELTRKVESAVEMLADRNSRGKTRKPFETLQPATLQGKGNSFKPTLPALNACFEEDEEA